MRARRGALNQERVANERPRLLHPGCQSQSDIAHRQTRNREATSWMADHQHRNVLLRWCRRKLPLQTAAGPFQGCRPEPATLTRGICPESFLQTNSLLFFFVRLLSAVIRPQISSSSVKSRNPAQDSLRFGLGVCCWCSAPGRAVCRFFHDVIPASGSSQREQPLEKLLSCCSFPTHLPARHRERGWNLEGVPLCLLD